MKWLGRLRALEENVHTPENEPTEPTKAPSVGSVGAVPKDAEVFSPRSAPAPAPAPPAEWSAADFREFFDERLAVAMIDGEQPETEARQRAASRNGWTYTGWRGLPTAASAAAGRWFTARRAAALAALRPMLGDAAAGVSEISGRCQ